MKRRTIVILTSILVLGGLTSGYLVRQSIQKKKAALKDIDTVKVERKDMRITMKSYGSVEPGNRVEVKAPVAGSVDSILVEEGAYIKAGTVLAWMSSTDRAILISAARTQGKDEMNKWADIYKPIPIVAPISGTIIACNIKPGQSFGTNDSIFVMSDRLVVRAQVDEIDITKVRRGQPVEIILDAVPKQVIHAEVKKIGFDAKKINNINKYLVDLDPNTTPDFMRSGMTANLTFLVEEKHQVLTLPPNTVRKSKGQWVLDLAEKQDADGIWQKKEIEVTLGERTDSLIEIASGIKEGDLIIVKKESTDSKQKASTTH